MLFKITYCVPRENVLRPETMFHNSAVMLFLVYALILFAKLTFVIIVSYWRLWILETATAYTVGMTITKIMNKYE